MDADLRYRAELADQFIASLDHLTSEQWHDLVRLQRPDDRYTRLSRELAAEAIQLMGDERAAVCADVLSSCGARLDAIVRRHALEPHVADAVRAMASAATQALLARNSYGFNAGAFGELIAPFRSYVDLPEAERTATRIVTPPGVARQASPQDEAR